MRMIDSGRKRGRSSGLACQFKYGLGLWEMVVVSGLWWQTRGEWWYLRSDDEIIGFGLGFAFAAFIFEC